MWDVISFTYILLDSGCIRCKGGSGMYVLLCVRERDLKFGKPTKEVKMNSRIFI